MAVDLEQARRIGRAELERTLAAADEWSCEWDYDEYDDAWVLIVDRVEYYKVADRFAERTNLIAPIVVSKADGSVTREVPSGRVVTSVRFPEDFDIELQRFPDDYMFRVHSRAQVSLWARRLRMFRFVRQTPRESWTEGFAACFRVHGRDVDALLREVGIHREPMRTGAGTFLGEIPIVAYFEDRLITVDETDGILRVSIIDNGDADETFAMTERLEQRMIDTGWEADRVETTAPYDQRCVVTPRRYPELFEPLPAG